MKAVIYARYSSDNQREESIEGQLRDCRAYAEYNGIDIVGEYIDRAFSAKTDDRPDFQRMVSDSSLIALKSCLTLSLSGSWTGLPVTVMILPFIDTLFARMVSSSFPSRKTFRTDPKVLFLNL